MSLLGKERSCGDRQSMKTRATLPHVKGSDPGAGRVSGLWSRLEFGGKSTERRYRELDLTWLEALLTEDIWEYLSLYMSRGW